MYSISFIRRMEYEIIVDNNMLLWYNSVRLCINETDEQLPKMR